MEKPNKNAVRHYLFSSSLLISRKLNLKMMRNKINNKCWGFSAMFIEMLVRGAHVAISFAMMASSLCINFSAIRFFSSFSFSINQRFYIPNSAKHASSRTVARMLHSAHCVHHLTTFFPVYNDYDSYQSV